jgi:hypothetical protein
MSYLLNGRQGIPKGQSKMDNPEKLATLGTQDENKRWTPLCEKIIYVYMYILISVCFTNQQIAK